MSNKNYGIKLFLSSSVSGTVPLASASLTASFQTLPFSVMLQDHFAIQLPTTGSVSGTFKVQGNADYTAFFDRTKQTVFAPLDWTDITGSVINPAQSNPVVAFHLSSKDIGGWLYARVAYTPGLNGSGTLYRGYGYAKGLKS